MRKLRLGTRGSQLALWQAEFVAREIKNQRPELEIETIIIKTKGDKILDVALSKIGDKGLFTREIENSLLAGEIDLAVHSMKDLPSFLTTGLSLGAVLKRVNPRDVLISSRGYTTATLPHNGLVGTSSLRRIAQLKNLRPDIRISDLRGNVETRIRKMNEHHLDAIILAYAGVERLGLSHVISEVISTESVLPAVGQGAIAVEIRKDDRDTADIVALINHIPTYITTESERAFLSYLEGGCQVPIACLAQISNGEIILEGLIASIDGKTVLRDRASGRLDQPETVGQQLAQNLLDRGGQKILQEIKELGE